MGSRRRSHTAVAVAAVGIAAALAACAGDDEGAAPTTAATPATTVSESDGPATPGTNAGPGSTTAADVPMASPPPISATPFDEDLNGLFAALPAAESIGIPPDWAVRELTSLSGPDLLDAPEADPLLGLLSCPDGVLRESAEVPWVSRRLATPGTELDNGLLAIELIVEQESAAEYAADVAALTETCTAGDQVVVEQTTAALSPGAPVAVPADTSTSPSGSAGAAPATASAAPAASTASIEATVLTLQSAPTADIPYPSAWTVVTAHDGERTGTILLSGLDFGDDWTELALPLAAQLFTEPQT